MFLSNSTEDGLMKVASLHLVLMRHGIVLFQVKPLRAGAKCIGRKIANVNQFG